MASGVLKQLGRVSTDWLEVSEWEARLLRRLIREVEGVPAFLEGLLDRFLVNIINNNSKNETTVTKIAMTTSVSGQ